MSGVDDGLVEFKLFFESYVLAVYISSKMRTGSVTCMRIDIDCRVEDLLFCFLMARFFELKTFILA